MGIKKSSTGATPKSIGANNLSTSARTDSQVSNLRHAFAPSQLGTSFFASVVQGLDAQVLRIHDTTSGLLTSQHSIHGGAISCLAWGNYYGDASDDRSSKRRKTIKGASNDQHGDVVVAIGLANEPRIELYSPAKGKIVASLANAHGHGIRDFCFSSSDRKAWSLGGDGKLVEWNLEDGSHSE